MKLLRIVYHLLPIAVLILVAIAGVNLQRQNRQLARRVADLESHAGAQDIAIITIGRSLQSQSRPVKD